MNDVKLYIAILGCVLLLGLVFCESFLSLGLSLYRKWGWNSLADWWEKRRAGWSLASRLVLGIAVASCLLTLCIMK